MRASAASAPQLRGVNHFARVREADTVTSRIGFDDGARALVRLMSSPVALEFQQHLQPTRYPSPGRFHPAKSEFVSYSRQSPARVANNKGLEPILQG